MVYNLSANGVALGHAALHFNPAAHGIDYAREFVNVG